jgi:hypothetical protein
MRRAGFVLGILLLVIAGAAGLAWIMGLFLAPGGMAVSIGSIWYGIHANSLVGFQALVEKSVGAAAWAPVQALLVWPTWLTLGLPGLALVLLCRPRRRAYD